MPVKLLIAAVITLCTLAFCRAIAKSTARRERAARKCCANCEGFGNCYPEEADD